MEFARRPPELSSIGPMDSNWRSWKQQFLAFLKVSGLDDDQPEVHKTSLLLNLIGPVGQQAFQNFSFESPSDKENMDIILEKFNEYYDPEKSEAHERNLFLTTKKRSNESIDQYVDELRIKARTCNFGDLTDSLIRDKIILEAKDRVLRKHLLSEPELSLSQTILLWHTHEQTAEKVKQIRDLHKPLRNDFKAKGSGDGAADTRNTSSSSRTNFQAKNENSGCSRCGTHHGPRNCPARGKKCGKCNAFNHLTEYCRNPPTAESNSFNNMATEMNRPQQQNFTASPVRQIPQQVMNKQMAVKNIKMLNKSSKDSSPDCCIA